MYSYLKSQSPVTIWLRDMKDFYISGTICGFDEFMNLTLRNAVEVNKKKGTERPIGTILLKGENVVLVGQSSASS